LNKFYILQKFMHKKVITIDCDEVLANTIDAVLEHHHYQVKWEILTREQITNYHLHEMKSLYMTQKEDKNYFDGFLRKKASIDVIQPVVWAREKLQALKDAGHTLYVVTWRSDELQHNTYAWVDKHYPSLFDDIVFANTHKYNQKKKSDICHDLQSILMVEDFLFYARDVWQSWIKTYLLDRPRNKEYDPQQDACVVKVKDRSEVEVA